MIDQQLPGLSSAFKDLSDGIAQSEQGRMMQVLSNGEFGRLSKEAAEGQIDAIELNNRLVDMAPGLLAKAERMGPAYVDALRSSLPAMASVLDNIGQLKDLAVKDRQAIEKEQKRREGLTSFFNMFEDTIKRFRRGLEDTFLASDLFKTITRMYTNLIKSTDPQGGLGKVLSEITTAFKGVLNWMNTFLLEVNAQGLTKTVEQRLRNLVIDIFNIDISQLADSNTAEEQWQQIWEIIKADATVALNEAMTAIGTAIGNAFVSSIEGLFKNPLVVGAFAAGGLLLAKNISIVIGLVLVWRGIWYVLDAIDKWIFNGSHFGSAVLGITIGLLILYLPDKDLKEIEKL
jgi:hypothetical protein